MAKPKIRFKGYTDDWEQRKLSELLYLSSERNDGSYTRDDVLAASLGTELQKKHIYFGLRATDESVKNYKVVLPNDVIYTKSPIKGFPNGIIRTSKGENGIVPTLYCVYHSVDVINPSIIQAYFESKERLDAYLVPLVNIGARNNVNITDKEFLDGSLCIPKDKDEQDKIVNVLERLSNLITLHQRKCEETKKLKKYMLQKMFPQNGQTVPEIRFAGFTDAWEQRKFSEFVKNVAVRNKAGVELECYAVTNDRGFISQKEAHDDFGYMAEVDTTAYNIVPPSSFAYNPARINVGSIGYYTGTENVIVSSLYEVFQTADYVDDRFMWHWFKSDHFPKWIERLQEGSVRLYFYYDKLIQCEMKMPSLEEQKKMGAFFDQLDCLITLHQCKCHLLLKLLHNDWEQRKLSDVVDSVDTGKSKFDKEGSSGEYPILGSTSVIGYDDEYDYEGDFILTARVGANAGSLYRHAGKVKISDNTVFIQASQNIEFLYQLLTRFDIKKLSFGTGQPLVKASELKSLELMMPTNMKEQMRIGAYFNQLDHLITLHQHKCEQLQSMKKFMLQNMFV